MSKHKKVYAVGFVDGSLLESEKLSYDVAIKTAKATALDDMEEVYVVYELVPVKKYVAKPTITEIVT